MTGRRLIKICRVLTNVERRKYIHYLHCTLHVYILCTVLARNPRNALVMMSLIWSHRCVLAPSSVFASIVLRYAGVLVFMYPSSMLRTISSLASWSKGQWNRKWFIVPLSLPHGQLGESVTLILKPCSFRRVCPLRSLLSITSMKTHQRWQSPSF